MSAAEIEEPGAGDLRRDQMLQAALDVIVERGFPETRIADVATRAGVSPALVIYYFKTKDGLLTAAMRYAEDIWYDEGARRTKSIDSASRRLEELVAMSCLPDDDTEIADSWALWLDLWAQAVRHPEVARVRAEFDLHWRESIGAIVRDGQAAGEFGDVDVEQFVLLFCALLDGFAVQIALRDDVVDSSRAFRLSMSFASAQLGFSWDGRRARPGGRRARKASTGAPVVPASTGARAALNAPVVRNSAGARRTGAEAAPLPRPQVRRQSPAKRREPGA